MSDRFGINQCLGGIAMAWFYLPVLIVVIANVTYDISSKSTPEELNAYAGVAITYSILAVFNFSSSVPEFPRTTVMSY